MGTEFHRLSPQSMNWSSNIEAAWRRPLLSAFLVFFSYCVAASAAIQFFVLPVLLPSLHAGHGLLAGGDYPGLHDIARRMALRISQDGWSAWELMPEGQSPAGLASIFYALTVSEPWTLIPVNAALHAMGGVIVMRLVQFLGADTISMLLCGALYAVPARSGWGAVRGWLRQLPRGLRAAAAERGGPPGPACGDASAAGGLLSLIHI